MANIYDMSDTWNDGATTFTSIKMNVVDTASSATSLLMDLQVGGSSRFSVSKSGNLRVNSTTGFISAGSSGTSTLVLGYAENITLAPVAVQTGVGLALKSDVGIQWSSSAVNGTKDVILRRDAAGTLAQRNSTNAQTFNLYNTYTDASNYERGQIYFSGNIFRIDTSAAGTGSSKSVGIYSGGVRYQIIGSSFNQFDQPIYMNTTGIATGATGFKICTSPTQGLGFWNATPSSQPSAVADATDAASVITQLNALLSRLRTIGLIAT